MIKKLICLVMILIMAFPLGGCWSRRELNELSIVLAAGIDLAPNGNIELTVQIARPNAFGGGAGQAKASAQENNVWVISQTGKTVFDAQRFLETKVSRDLYWGHTVILVFGEQLARDGIRQAINYFSRSPRARETIWVLVTRGKAKDILNSHSQLETTSAQSIGAMVRTEVGVPVMLKDLSMMLSSKGTNPVLPRIELTASGEPQGPGMQENIPQAKEQEQPQGAMIHAEPTITGTGVFKDDRLVGWLDMPETRGLLWLKDQMEKGEISVPSPTEPGKDISIRVANGSTNIEPYFDGQNIWFDVKMTMEGDLWEQQSTEELTNLQIFTAIEKNMASRIEQKARMALDKAQQDYEVDIFGFGEAFHRKYKKEWANIKDRWDEVFINADINIAVQAYVRRTGLTTNRISKKE